MRYRTPFSKQKQSTVEHLPINDNSTNSFSYRGRFESCNANRFGACHSSSVVLPPDTSSSIELIDKFDLLMSDSVLFLVDRHCSSLRDRFFFWIKPKIRNE